MPYTVDPDLSLRNSVGQFDSDIGLPRCIPSGYEPVERLIGHMQVRILLSRPVYNAGISQFGRGGWLKPNLRAGSNPATGTTPSIPIGRGGWLKPNLRAGSNPASGTKFRPRIPIGRGATLRSW